MKAISSKSNLTKLYRILMNMYHTWNDSISGLFPSLCLSNKNSEKKGKVAS
jgi:hypothetical protein